MGCLPPVFQCEGWFWGLRERFSPREFKLGEEWRRSRGWGRGGGQGGESRGTSPFPGIWELVVLGVFQLLVLSRGRAGSDAALENQRGSGWVDTPSVSSFLRGPEEPAHQGPATEEMAPGCWSLWISQGFLPATGILIGLQIDYLETKGEIFHGNFAGPKTPDPQSLGQIKGPKSNIKCYLFSSIYIKRALSLSCTANKHCTGSQTRQWSPRPCKALFLTPHILLSHGRHSIVPAEIECHPIIRGWKVNSIYKIKRRHFFSFLFFFTS